jgi:hypothetical protein
MTCSMLWFVAAVASLVRHVVVAVCPELSQYSAQMPAFHNEQMVQAFSAHGADEPLP